ncbi:hypothetical protein Pmani_027517 [Petrolisthes manimaculis]|uniref:CCR4-NOT transcription complex subunit 9 n=1 Tax=Petrolisthes manimaculis TaxID=1843537 RepID=A0AAE1TVP1_9EUCA|nr:hypothetical protein Pmani_027517 [Petrolisthes manimaculis]
MNPLGNTQGTAPGQRFLGTGSGITSAERDKIYQWIIELANPETRENALLELSKKRESVPDLAPLLWNSFGTIAALLQEIINIYPAINPATLTAHQSNRVCNALALLQCVASHPETRSQFLAAHIPLYLYPFLQTVSKTRPFEYLRLTSLGVIGALVKTYERFSHVAMILGKMVIALAKEQSARLLKHVIRCYLRLSDNPRAREALRQCLPDQLQDQTFAACLKDDKSTKHWLQQLLANLESTAAADPRIAIPPLPSQ